MKRNAFWSLTLIKKVNSYSVCSQSHAYLILHCLCKTEKSFIKTNCWTIRSIFLICHTQVKSNVSLFLNVFSTHPCFCSHQKLSQRPLFAREKRNWRSITRTWTYSRCYWAVRRFRRLNSDLFFIEALRSRYDVRFFKKLDCFLKMFFKICLSEGLISIFSRRIGLISFLKLQ